MTIATEAGYTWVNGKYPRLLHAGNMLPIKSVSADEDSGSTADLVLNDLTRDRWVPFANEVVSPTDFSTADWTPTNVTVSADGQTLDEGTASGLHQVVQTGLAIANGISRVASLLVDRQTAEEIIVQVIGATTNAFVSFNLTTGVVQQETGTGTSGKIVDLGGGRYLCRMTYVPAATESAEFRFFFTRAISAVDYVGEGLTVKVLRMTDHLSETTLTLDTFGAQAGTCFAIGAHNLWSSGATIAFLASERVENGTFAAGTTGWASVGSPTLVVSGGEVSTTLTTAFGGLEQTISGLTAGKKYRFVAFARISTATNVAFRVYDGNAIGVGTLYQEITTSTTSEELIIDMVPTGTEVTIYMRVSGTAGQIGFFGPVSGRAFEEVTPENDSPIMFFFDETTADDWSIQISGGALPEIGVVRIGNPLVFARPFYSGASPAEMNRATEVIGNISRSGELLGRSIRRTILSEPYTFQNLPYVWVRANLGTPTGVIRSLEKTAAFMAWRPEVTDDASYIMKAQVSPPVAAGTRDLWNFSMTAEVYSYE